MKKLCLIIVLLLTSTNILLHSQTYETIDKKKVEQTNYNFVKKGKTPKGVAKRKVFMLYTNKKKFKVYKQKYC